MFQATNIQVYQNATFEGKEKTLIAFDVRYTAPDGVIITYTMKPLVLKNNATQKNIDDALAAFVATMNL